MKFAKMPNGRYYGENKKRKCSNCYREMDWKLLFQNKGDYLSRYCECCLSTITKQKIYRQKRNDVANQQFMMLHKKGYRGEGPYGSLFNAMLASKFREWMNRMNNYGMLNNEEDNNE